MTISLPANFSIGMPGERVGPRIIAILGTEITKTLLALRNQPENHRKIEMVDILNQSVD